MTALKQAPIVNRQILDLVAGHAGRDAELAGRRTNIALAAFECVHDHIAL